MANNLVFRGGVKIVGNLALSTGDDILTRNSTSKEVGYTPAIDASNFLTTNLNEGYLIVGNASDIATAVLMTGDVTMSSLGVTSIAANVITNLNVNSAAGIAYSKLNLVNAITNNDIATAANIARTKLASGNAYRLVINDDTGKMDEADALDPNLVLVSDGNGIPTVSSVSTTVLEYVDISSSLQTTLNNKLDFNSAITPVSGDLISYSAGSWTALNAGAEGEVLTIVSGVPAWATGISNGLPAGGVAGQFLISDGTGYDASWTDLTLSLVTDVTATAAEVNLLDGATFTAEELNFITGATSNLQTQIDLKLTAVLPHHAMYVGNSSDVPSVLAAGTPGQVLQMAGGSPTWQTLTGTGTVTSIDVSGGTTGMTFTGGPVSTTGTITLSGTLEANNGGTGYASYAVGDLLYADTTSTLTKLNVGVDGQALILAGGVPTWDDITVFTDGDYGDITLSSSTSVWTVDADIAKAWTGAQSWRDNNWSLLDNADTSKILNFQLSSISASTTRTLTVPNQNGTIAVLTDLRQTIEYTSLTAHGFTVGTALKKGATVSAWSAIDGTVDTQEDFRGVVVEVIDTDNFVIALPGSRITGLSGLTAGSIHYAQSGGNLSTVVTQVKVLYADSATTGYILAGGSASSGHVIQEEGYDFTARGHLNFIGAKVEDDSGNDATKVEIVKAPSTLTDAATISWDHDTHGWNAKVTLGGNRTLGTITNPTTGTFYTLRVIQDGTGSRTLAYHADYLFNGSRTPQLKIVPGEWTILRFYYDGTNFVHLEQTLADVSSQYRFESVTTIDQDVWLYQSIIKQIVKSAGVATASYKINGGSTVAITFTGNTWTGTIAVATNDILTWIITYTPGYTTAALTVNSSRQ